jgi:hypothetical protein
MQLSAPTPRRHKVLMSFGEKQALYERWLGMGTAVSAASAWLVGLRSRARFITDQSSSGDENGLSRHRFGGQK